MKESLWGYYLVLLGITVSTVMIMVSNMTTSNQQNYYLLKEVTNAAMIDAIDYAYYREYGTIKINTEKFVENFLRRFSEGISKTNTYKIDFYSIYENPPSVSIRVTTNTGDFNIVGDSTNIDVINSIDAIMEANNTIVETQEYQAVPYDVCDESKYITSDDDDKENYGYCRLMDRLQFNMEEGSDLLKKIKDKVQLGSGETFDMKKLKVLKSEFLSILTEEDIDPIQNGGSKTIYYKDMGYTASSIYTQNANTADISGIGSDETIHMAINIRNVNLSVVKDKDNNNFYLAYGLEYNCDDSKGNRMNNVFKTYRNIVYECKGSEINEEDWDAKSEDAKKDENCSITFNYISENKYNTLSETEKKGYKKAPYYDACIVGIKYNVSFYYDRNA